MRKTNLLLKDLINLTTVDTYITIRKLTKDRVNPVVYESDKMPNGCHSFDNIKLRRCIDNYGNNCINSQYIEDGKLIVLLNR